MTINNADDICDLFNETLPQIIADNPEKVKSIKGTFQVNIQGAGQWFIDPVSDPPSCVPGVGDADATLTISATDFVKLAANPKKQAAGMLFFGKLKVSGDKGLAMASATKLGELFGGK
jgi:hypothetical protein